MKYQKLYNIAFSDDRSVRWKRHFFFWLVVLLYHFARISMMFPVINKNSFLSLLELTFFWGLILNIFFSYSIVYYLIPKYFKKKKYWQFAIAISLVFLIMQFLLQVNSLVISGTPVIKAIGYYKGMELLSYARPSFIRSFGNPPLIFGLFLSLKTLKGWHLEQLKTETLSKENANAELQLLKAQVHPHFLFNTLNNIYSFSLNQSPLAGTLVKKLSGMLDYMIHECEEKFVPLEKEIRLIQDYLGLEKVRYGKRLDMQIEIHGDFENQFIAPLLMIPFVENSFKHGTSQMLQHPWIRLEITTVKDQLFFKLSNSKPSLFLANKQNKGIGLINVKKRLQLLYPGKHQLDVTESEDMFTVNMQILLEEKVIAENKIIEADKALAYA